MFKSDHAIKIIASMAVLSLAISLFAHYNSRFPGDLQLTILLQSIHSKSLLIAMEGISYITGNGPAAILTIIICIAVWYSWGKVEAGMVALAGLISLIDEIFKIVINRPRPSVDLVTIQISETGKSFPSGHAFFAMIVLGMLVYLAIKHQVKHNRKVLILLSSSLLILWIGISRIYLGVHWMSDVVGGYLIGFLFLVVLIHLYHRLKFRTGARA